MTNDGALARRLELPATGWVRRYRVRVHGTVEPHRLGSLAKGITIDGVTYGEIRARLDRQQGDNAWLTMSLTGKWLPHPMVRFGIWRFKPAP